MCKMTSYVTNKSNNLYSQKQYLVPIEDRGFVLLVYHIKFRFVLYTRKKAIYGR